MTEVRSNMFGKYSENDVRLIREENRILEMRWEVFEGLYDRTRQELEKVQYALTENARLRQQIAELENETSQFKCIIEERHKEEMEGLNNLLNEAIFENEKLHDEIDRLQGEFSQLKNPNSIEENLPFEMTEEEINQLYKE